jgi:hypothetical protein
LAIPPAAAVLAMVLRDAYATPGIRSSWEAVLRPAFSAGCAFLVVLSWPAVAAVDHALGRRVECAAGLHHAFPAIADLSPVCRHCRGGLQRTLQRN